MNARERFPGHVPGHVDDPGRTPVQGTNVTLVLAGQTTVKYSFIAFEIGRLLYDLSLGDVSAPEHSGFNAHPRICSPKKSERKHRGNWTPSLNGLTYMSSLDSDAMRERQLHLPWSGMASIEVSVAHVRCTVD